ncbi:MAG: DUF3990 domain-containing protein [Bacilli bacterium]|nr:DUF3990 domain-containing protein [Bacilli bacterium]
MEYRISQDIAYAKEVLALSYERLAEIIGVSPMTLQRWAKGDNPPSGSSLEKLYGAFYSMGLRLSLAKSDMYLSEANANVEILFHGSKEGIVGPISLDASLPGKDFGPGFYCGLSLEQTAAFVCSFPRSSVYVLSLSKKGLKTKWFDVDKDWMYAIAYYRGYLKQYENARYLRKLLDEIEAADIIYAPIADNTMFDILEAFYRGEITDEQCIHSLSANRLGRQVVLRSTKALGQLKSLGRLYLCEKEKEDFLSKRRDSGEAGRQKMLLERRKYAGVGHYIEELFHEGV